MRIFSEGCSQCPQAGGVEVVEIARCGHCGSPVYQFAPYVMTQQRPIPASCDCHPGPRIITARRQGDRLFVLEAH